MNLRGATKYLNFMLKHAILIIIKLIKTSSNRLAKARLAFFLSSSNCPLASLSVSVAAGSSL